MYLKSLTLKGFKSFPDRTRLEFSPGVSVIVGPNGSGKSNITDAVMWALGEQSPMAVRGQSMQDVIFGGAPGRKASPGAEVELVLDDSEGSLNLGTSEISVFRRLDRNGEGEYRLAGARCRLVDVIEVLSDTGLGKEMHSVISQGRVEAIVTSKPRDRRLLIEEAAGLGKHRKRRRRAQLKLERTQANLDRALDVEREARSRLRPLKRQAEAAELHARLERQLLEVRWELSRDELRAVRLELEGAQAASGGARQERARVERELSEVAKRREAAEEALAARSERREELSRRRFVAQSAADRVADRAERARGAQSTVTGRLDRARGVLGEFQAQAALDVPDAEPEQRIAQLEQSLAALARDRQAELERALAALQQERERARAEFSSRAEAAQAAQARRAEGEQTAEAARGVQRQAERVVETARREAARIGGELAAVNQFLRSHAATGAGTSALAEQLEVRPGYELALAAALDGRLGAAVVADRDAADTLLDRAGDDGGRALLLGAGTTGHRPGAVIREDAGHGPGSGATLLLELVGGSPAAVALAGVLLADTWVVDSLQQLPDSFTGSAVTRGGRVWSPSTRELRQAPAIGEERVLAQRNRRQELVRLSEEAVRAELAAGAAVNAAAAELAELEAARDAIGAGHRDAVRARDEAAEEERRIGAQIERRRGAPDDGPNAGLTAQLSAELTAERGALERAERERAHRAGQIERLRGAIAYDEALAPALERVIAALQDAGEVIAAQRGTFEQALAADRAEGEDLATELRTCAQQEAGLHAELQRRNDAVTETEVRMQRARDRTADAGAELQRLAERLALEATPAAQALAPEQLEALRTRLQRLGRRREQLGPVNPLAQDEYAEAVAHVEELERQRTDLETALRELERLITDTDRQIQESFEQTFAAAARNFEEVSAQLFPGGRGRLRLVSERSGPAPVLGGAAPEDPDEAGVEGAPGAGGEAEAGVNGEATIPEDLLGVEIEITPAGKDMKRLTLLSGGEKSMTALAFLFSVFLARPCPFYILDEVEAALDDLNIDRFLALLRRYAERAQFIVVTHQKRTMEAADALYGVSMGADGISKVISRRLPPAEAAA